MPPKNTNTERIQSSRHFRKTTFISFLKYFFFYWLFDSTRHTVVWRPREGGAMMGLTGFHAITLCLLFLEGTMTPHACWIAMVLLEQSAGRCSLAAAFFVASCICVCACVCVCVYVCIGGQVSLWLCGCVCPVSGMDAQASLRGGRAPYFSPMTPPDSSAPNGRPFYYTPGETYTFPPPGYSIEIWDDDLNNTVNGHIPTKKRNFCPSGAGNIPDTVENRGCFEPNSVATLFPGTNGKYIEDPVHIEVGAYIGSPDWNPGNSRWWFPYRSGREATAPRADFSYNDDPFESMKQKHRCSEYNPTLPGLEWHAATGQVYPGNVDTLLHYPNVGQPKCWGMLNSDKMNVTYQHGRTADGKILTNRTRLSVTFKEDASLLNSEIPNPQRTICLTWKGMAGSIIHLTNPLVEKTRCWSIIFNVKPKLSVCNGNEGNGPDINKCGKLSLFKTDANGDGSIVPVAVGQHFMSYVYFEDGNRDMTTNCSVCDSLKISVVSDPGLPNTATLGANMGPHDMNLATDAPSREVPVFVGGQQSTASYFQYSRQLSFKPDALSAMQVGISLRNGLKYKMCFFATSSTQTFYPPGIIDMHSKEVCAYIQIVRPEPQLSNAGLIQLQPYDEPLMMVTEGQESVPFQARVRCPYKWRIDTYDTKDGDLTLRLATDFIAGYQKGTYTPMAKVDPANRLPEGAKLMHEPGAAFQILSWSPERGMEGKTFEFCLLITDSHIAEGSHRKCTSIEVLKCEVCGLPSDTLQSISVEYKTDWLQLWGANYEVENPNMLVDYVKLKLGPMYTLNKQEMTDTLAKRFSMDTPSLLEVNPDLMGNASLVSGTHVCLMPRICGAL